jgi:hypothetical protein
VTDRRIVPTSSTGDRDDHVRQAPRATCVWCLRGAAADLRALAIDTSFGHALDLELDDELILLLLQPDWDTLVAYATRLHRSLIDLGWLQ